ncbi:MAG: DUF1326 domain-containing protein [Planctomycetes bacterium]|nr:DUF1326 domain-containing protein [Planctomycetota bacterium]
MILAPFLTSLCSTALPPADLTPTGRYVEARTASVYAGACHFGGEVVTDGREALLAWRFDSGSYRGVDLSGLSLAVLVADEANLALASSGRRAVVYTPAAATPEQQAGLVGWVRQQHASLLGEVRAVRPVDLQLEVGAEAFTLRVPEVLELRGDALPDRACCKMPFDVWYSPLETLHDRLVGHDQTFDVREPLLACSWSRPGENAAFFGTFGAR